MMPPFLRSLTYEGVPVWRHARIVQWTLQIVSGVAAVALVIWFIANIGLAIDSRNIPFGFGFLDTEYQTPIGEHFIPYDPSDTYLHALLVAAVNTLVVAVLGVILATILGIIIGVARLSSNWLVSKLALIYVEFFRNVPLLVQLLFWFFIVLTLPPVREGIVFIDLFYLNNSGVSLPGPSGFGSMGVFFIWVALAILGIGAGVLLFRRLADRELALGGVAHPVMAGWAMALAVIVGSWIILSMTTGTSPIEWSTPAPEGRFGRIAGGVTFRAGLVVVLLGLVIYTAAFIAEIVRAGIQSVGRGQTEAARSLGLTPMGALRAVIFPQALRVIIPPLISQYLNLTKNSSLGAAVGYPELTGVGITMTQRESALSIFILIMATYLAMSLTWSLIGNLYNRHISFERRR